MAVYSSPDQATNELHRLFLVAVPENSLGNKTITHYSELAGVSKAVIWKWIKNGRLPPAQARKLVEVSEGRVSLDQLHRFVYAD